MQILLDIVSLINADFYAGAVLITMGGVLGKLTHAQMLFDSCICKIEIIELEFKTISFNMEWDTMKMA